MGIGRARAVVTVDEIFDLVREDLRAVEIAIGVESAASVPAVTTPISKYLERSGEKRLRAGLLLLCSRFAGGGNSRMAVQLGAVVEMIHAATLIHDEMIDGAHSDAVNRACVLAGDWLYIRAFRVALEERVLDVVLCAAQTMVAAGLMQRDRIGLIDIAESDCVELANRKTACLFSACGKLGAAAGGVDPRDGEKLTEFAWNLGMAFQLTDDVLQFSRERALEFTDRARQILADFPDSDCRRALFMLADLVTQRDC